MIARKKRGSRKVATRRGKSARRKPAVKAKAKTRKKTAGRRPARKTASKRIVPRKSVKRKASPRRLTRGRTESSLVDDLDARGLGPLAAGQSGDTEGLSRAELADSESVEELVEEGQAFEAGIVSGVENAPPAGRRGVRTRQVPEDDVPQEYLDED
jgi:hypothetical protein